MRKFIDYLEELGDKCEEYQLETLQIENRFNFPALKVVRFIVCKDVVAKLVHQLSRSIVYEARRICEEVYEVIRPNFEYRIKRMNKSGSILSEKNRHSVFSFDQSASFLKKSDWCLTSTVTGSSIAAKLSLKYSFKGKRGGIRSRLSASFCTQSKIFSHGSVRLRGLQLPFGSRSCRFSIDCQSLRICFPCPHTSRSQRWFRTARSQWWSYSSSQLSFILFSASILCAAFLTGIY